MIITYHGNHYFKIQSGETTMLVDPDNQRSFKGAALVLFTTKPSSVPFSTGNDFLACDHQGEYETHGIRITGISGGFGQGIEYTLYHIVFDDITIGILGFLNSDCTPAHETLLKHADIIFVPASYKPAALAKFLRQTEPGIIIPAIQKDPQEITLLAQELNQNPTAEEKLVIKKKEIIERGMKIHILMPK